MDFKSTDAALWRKALLSYESVVKSLGKPDLIPLDDFYRKELPNLLHQREPEPYITTAELCRLMDWKLSRGKWRRRLQSFVSSLKNAVVKDASRKAFAALPNIPKAVVALTVLRGVGPATASAVLAAYVPEVAPFMSDEALEAVLGDSKDYSLKRYVIFVQKMQAKAKELSSSDDIFTPSDVERALWSCKVGDKVRSSSTEADESSKKSKRESTKADEVELNKKSKRESTKADEVELDEKSKRESTKADDIELNKKSKRESTKADEVELNEKSKRESTKADDVELNKKSKRDSTKTGAVELNKKSKRNSTKADEVELNKKSKRNSTKADDVELNKKSKKNSTKADDVELNEKSKRKRK